MNIKFGDPLCVLICSLSFTDFSNFQSKTSSVFLLEKFLLFFPIITCFFKLITLHFKSFQNKQKNKERLRMPWSQDVVLYVLLSYLLPSLPICKKECWYKQDTMRVYQYLLIRFCAVSLKQTRELLETFVRKELYISSSKHEKKNLACDLDFLIDIKNRFSFTKIDKWKSSVYCFYASSFLIQQKADFDQEKDHALQYASERGYKDTVALLLEHKANVHVNKDAPLRRASEEGLIDVIAVLLEHKANVHAENNGALQFASFHGHMNIVD
jgi:hypothetical protein